MLVWKFDRFARSTRHLLTALEEFNHHSIRFVRVQDQVDTDSPMGRALFTIIGAMAPLESSLISERVTAGMKAAATRGKHLGRPPISRMVISEVRPSPPQRPSAYAKPTSEWPEKSVEESIGPEVAAVLWSEGLSRQFDNRRQIAAYAGLAPTPWQSGQIDREQGASKSGNARLRTTLVQVAWLWLRHQPDSALSNWFKERVQQNGGRQKKTAIVALARKLLVSLWKYVNAGVVIEGAVLAAA